MIRAASTDRAATSGWTRSVTSVAVPPVLRFALRRIRTRCPAVRDRVGRVSLLLASTCSAIGSRTSLLSTVAWSSPRRGSRLTRADELGDRVPAVADDLGRVAAGGGDDAAADDQDAVIGAGGEPLDDDLGPVRTHAGVGRLDLLAGAQVRGDPAPLAAELRLDDDRAADLLGGRPGVLGVLDRPPLGDRYADLLQQAAGELLVLRDRLGDGAGAVGLGRQDAPLPRPVAEQHQALGS